MEKKTTLDYAHVDAYAQKVFDAIVNEDFGAYLELTIHPDDLDNADLVAVRETVCRGRGDDTGVCLSYVRKDKGTVELEAAIDKDGRPLMDPIKRDWGGMTWDQYHKERFTVLLNEIDRAGGMHTVNFVRHGKAFGYLMDEHEFLGNIYTEITIGNPEKPMVFEIGSTQVVPARGRLLMVDSRILLQSLAYYQANVP